MNPHIFRIRKWVSGVFSCNPIERLSFIPVQNSTLLCQKGSNSHIHFAVTQNILRKSTQRILISTAIQNPRRNEHQRKAYCTQTPHRKPPGERDEAKHQDGHSKQISYEANLRSNTDEKSKTEKMNMYVRKATEAKEKIKEKMADRVRDMEENVFTIPNLLSTTRLVLSPVLGYLVIHEFYTVGALLFTFAGITDLLDGYIARNFKNQQSVLGSIIDPLADKCLVTILAVSLTVSGLIPVPLTALIICRDVGLVGSVFYLRYQSLSPPRTISKFFNVTHATVQLKPTTISKLNTAVQLGLVGFTLAAPVFQYVDHPLLHALWYTTAATTILSGFSYVFSKDAFKFLRK